MEASTTDRVAISKRIGWDGPPLTIPTADAVKRALNKGDYASLLRWNRFCVSPEDEEKAAIVGLIVEGLRQIR